MREHLFRALVEVGCPKGLAGQVLDRYGEIEVGAGPQGEDDVFVADTGIGWAPDRPQAEFAEAARDLAVRLADANAVLRGRAVHGEPVPLYWPLRQARSGEVCPESGYWMTPGRTRTLEAFAAGNLLPPLHGRRVTWYQVT